MAAQDRVEQESRFGHSFANVSVHSDGAAASSARQLAASAYTVGSDIAFASGRYEPASARGHRLLAHELAHVVQQSGAVRPELLELGPPNSPAEREARTMAAGAPGARSARASATARPAVQYVARDDEVEVYVNEESLMRDDPRYVDRLVSGAATSMILHATGVALQLEGREQWLFIPHGWFDWSQASAQALTSTLFASRQNALDGIAGRDGPWYAFWKTDQGLILPTVFSPATAPRACSAARGAFELLAESANQAANEFVIMAVSMVTLGLVRLGVNKLYRVAGNAGLKRAEKMRFEPESAPAAAPKSAAPAKAGAGSTGSAPAKEPARPKPAGDAAAPTNRPKPTKAVPKEGETPEQYYERTRGKNPPLTEVPPAMRNLTIDGARRDMAVARVEQVLADPKGTWTHYLTKGGYQSIMRSQSLEPGGGNVGWGLGEGVRAVPGPFASGTPIKTGRLYLDFQVTKPPVAGSPTQFNQMGMGAMWHTKQAALPIQVTRVGYTDGSEAVHLGGKRWRLTSVTGTERDMDLDTLLQLGESPMRGLQLPAK